MSRHVDDGGPACEPMTAEGRSSESTSRKQPARRAAAPSESSSSAVAAVKLAYDADEDDMHDSHTHGSLSDDDDDDDDDFQVEDLLWAAQMDLIGHRHASAIQKLQHAVALGSSAACATLGNLLSHGFRAGGEHAACVSPPTRSATMPDPIAHAHATTTTKQSLVATDGSLKRPTPLRTATMPPTQSASTSHQDSLAAAELFATGLEIELGKLIQADANGMLDDEQPMYSDEEGSEGKYFGLERALDLVVGLTDSFRFGILVPPPAHEHQSNGQLSLAEELWSKGAILAHQVLAHPSVTLTQPVLTSLSSSASSPRPRSLSRSLSRSYAHPSTNLPAPQMSSPHPHLSGETRLQLTINVHLLYLLALHVWPTDQKRAEDFWKELVRLGSKGVGTKEGEEMVERAKRRIDNLHRDGGPDESWHTAKARGRAQRAARKQQGDRAQTDESLSFERSTGDALQEMKEEIERDKQEAARERAQAVLDVKGKGRAYEGDLEDSTAEHSRFGSSSSAVTIKPSSGTDNARASTSPTPVAPLSRTPRPSKFHFGADETSHEYPSPPTTPPSTSSPVSAKEPPAESLAPNLLREQTTEPDSYFSSQIDHQDATKTSLTRLPRNRTRASSVASSTASCRVPVWTMKQLTRTRSSASVATLPPDFGSSSLSTDRSWTASSSRGVLSQAVVADFAPLRGKESLTKTRSRSVSSASQRTPSASDEPGSKSWSSTWRAKFSTLRDKPAQFFAPNDRTNVGRGDASDLLRQVLVRDQTAAMYGGINWDFDERDECESGIDGEGEDDDPNRAKFDDDTSLLLPPELETPSVQVNGATQETGRSRRPSNSTASVNGLPVTGRKASRKHALRRVGSSLSQRSFFDPTTCESRWTPPPPPPPTLPNSDPAESVGLLSPTSAANAPQSHSAPPLSRPQSRLTLPVNPRLQQQTTEAGMDPLLLDLERKSRVGVKTVCANCGKKGLNYPKSAKGETFCSRECRVKSRKGRSGNPMTEGVGGGRQEMVVKVDAGA
ncbi:hypothetical protein OIV83_004231 [Microbotryomycetes sp. JL201]|nr:hypothetical protein OIV83_004231 [Microbotryomycetes sp. JL201]